MMTKRPLGGRAVMGADPDIVRWVQDMQAQRRSPYTIKHYALCVRNFQDWLEEELNLRIPLAKAGESDLKQYQLWLSTQKHYAKTSLYATIKALQAFYRFLELDVADNLRPPRRNQGLPKYLTEAEAQRLMSAASNHARDHAFVALLLYGGFRVGELVRILATDIDFDEGTIRVRSGKGDKDRLAVVPTKCMSIIRQWLHQRPKARSDYLFQGQRHDQHVTEMTVQRVVRKRARDAGIEKHVTPHVLRHTLATTLLRRGGDIRFIQRILGHASIATTQIYTHLDDAQLKRMYERAQPEF